MDCKKVAVDIPIGLSRGKQIRKCDLDAKKMLFGHNTLFYAPPRAIQAETPQDFQRLHRMARRQGAGLPVWEFLEKVREANSVMTQELHKRIVEFHPELTWFRLAGKASNPNTARRESPCKPPDQANEVDSTGLRMAIWY
jgi:predicted RNase H-like nuclease